MLALSLAFLSLFSVADAAPVVLHAESDAEAVRLDVLSSATSLDGDVAVTHFDAFRSSLAPALMGGVGLKVCSQEVSDPLSELLQRAEGSLSYLELEKAGEALQSAREQLRCISTPADPKQAARIGFLQGVIAIEAEDKASAWTSFSQAVRFQPDIAWDEQFPPDGKTILGLAKAELEKSPQVSVGLIPGIEEQSEIWLNGARLPTPASEMSVAPGANLLQVKGPQGLNGFEVTVKGDTNPRLFLPSLIPDDALSWVHTDDGQQKLSAVVNQAFDSGTSVIVAHDGGLWRSASGMTTWETIRPAKGTGIPRAARPMAWLSTGVTVGLATATGLMWSRAATAKVKSERASQSFESAASTGRVDVASAQYQKSMNQQTIRTRALVVTSVGTMLTAGGIVVTIPLYKAEK
ncbi:MAG: hypothetical protein ACPGTU_07475 [Myxococcota bacterium]